MNEFIHRGHVTLCGSERCGPKGRERVPGALTTGKGKHGSRLPSLQCPACVPPVKVDHATSITPHARSVWRDAVLRQRSSVTWSKRNTAAQLLALEEGKQPR